MKPTRLLLAIAFLIGSALHAATFTVTNANDTGAGSLRAALASAAAAGGADIVNFAAGLSGQTITLTSGSLGTADAGGVTIDATALPGGITLQANGTVRVFYNSSGGVLTLRALTLTGGFNASGGGAIYNDHATLTLERCTIMGSTSSIGAGLLTETGSTTTLRQCTFSGNTASSQGGGVYNRGTTTLVHCTVKGNTSQGDSGGIYNQAGFALALENSIVAGNTAATTAPDILNFGTLTRNGANIVQAGVNGTGTLAGSGTIANVNPQLSALGNFGGPTRTMLPGAGSPAIDQAVGSTETVDQRGFPRPVDSPSSPGTAADIGAVEVQLPDANLSNLVLSAGTLSPAFAAATTSYTATVPVGTASITVTPTASNANASITVNSAPVATGTPSGSIALNLGANTITTVVTAPDAFPVKTYTLTVYRPSVVGEIFVTSASDTGPGSVRDVFDAVNDAFNTNPTYTTINIGGVTSSSGATFNPYPLLRPKSGTLTIEGGGTGTLDGGGATRPIFIYSGSVTLHNLTLANTKAFGGNGRDGAGGGAGLGGGIFIYKGANVIADHVTFSASSATGGNGGSDGGGAVDHGAVGGGGGGMGGHGGASGVPLIGGAFGGGGGGGGLGGNGGGANDRSGGGGGGIRSGSLTGEGGGLQAAGIAGQPGGFLGPFGGALTFCNFPGTAGANGGGGASQSPSLSSTPGGGGGLAGYIPPGIDGASFTEDGGWGGGAGGGSRNGGDTTQLTRGGAGGFGGGGGGGGFDGNYATSGGAGGYGGGGGSATDIVESQGGFYLSGGAGGFGGGGGGGGVGKDGSGGGGHGGFGAGNGGSGDGFTGIPRNGGGGLGAGGAVFVMAGATFTAIDPVFTGAFNVAGGAAGGPGSGVGQGIGAGLFLGGDATIQVTSGKTITLPNIADFIGGGLDLEAAGGLTKTGPGTLVFSNSNSYVGGTTLADGVLSVSADNQLGGAAGSLAFSGGTLRVTGTTFASTARNMSFGTGGIDIADPGNTFALAQSLTGPGALAKSGAGQLALIGNVNYSGATTINGGTLQLDNGLGGSGDTVTVASSATLLAKGSIARRIANAGTITANNAALILGDLMDPNGFNSGAGGTLNIGNNQVVLFSQSKAVLGAQTNLGPGATLVTVNGLQLGNAASVDVTKVLTAAGPASVQGAFTNNGVVHGPTGGGQNLAFQNAVNGAGNFTGNVVFNGGYSPGNSPASVTLQNATFSAVNVLTMELGGTAQGSGYDHLTVTGTAALGGTLVVTLVNGFTPAAGASFDFLDGNTTGSFANISLPPLGAGLAWDASQLATNGTLTVVSTLTPLEAWRQLHFGSPANSGNGADLFDFDRDGLANLVEFAFGLDPKLPASLQLPPLQRSGGNLFYSFTEPPGVGGITYGAEWSTTLAPGSWTAIPDIGTPPGHVFTMPAGTNERFFLRFVITAP